MTNLFTEGFYLKSNTGSEITIPINAKVSVISDDSASGKTKMINYIDSLLKSGNIAECNYDLDKIRVIKNIKEWNQFVEEDPIEYNVVFVDNFDLTDFRESVPFIESLKNYFILCAHRRLPKCGWCSESYLRLEHDGLNYKLSVQDWWS